MNEVLSTSVGSTAFWVGLAEIISVNLILSGDNAVVIALAARSLPRAQQARAIAWGSGAAVGLRIVLTVFAAALLRLAWLKLIGGGLLLWIGVKLLVPDSGDENLEASENLVAAIRTILFADVIMSLDNVIAVAAAAGDSLLLLILGLAISIPLVIFGSTLLLRLMERLPIIVTAGAALIGFVAGEMAIGDRAVNEWMHGSLDAAQPIVAGVSPETLCGLLGAFTVLALGRWTARRKGLLSERASGAESRRRQGGERGDASPPF